MLYPSVLKKCVVDAPVALTGVIATTTITVTFDRPVGLDEFQPDSVGVYSDDVKTPHGGVCLSASKVAANQVAFLFDTDMSAGLGSVQLSFESCPNGLLVGGVGVGVAVLA